MNILIFDRDFVFKDVAYAPLITSGALMTKTYTVKEPGYAFLYISNEHPYLVDVYFDDVTIGLTPGKVVQEDDYYPFGLSFGNYQRENSLKNHYQYNAKELQDELSLGWFDYGARMYMPEIGRWSVIDPKADVAFHFTPFRYGYNNPLRFADSDGRTEEERLKAVAWSLAYMKAHYNDKWAERTNDCAFLVASSIMAAGFKDLRTGAGLRGTNNAVAMMAGNMREIKVDQARAGDAVTFNTGRFPPRGTDGEFDHIGIITKVITDERGTTIGYEVVQYQGKGPREQTVMLNKEHAFLRIKGAWQWDTPEEVEDNNTYNGPLMEPLVFIGQRSNSSNARPTLHDLEIPAPVVPKRASDSMYSPEFNQWWQSNNK